MRAGVRFGTGDQARTRLKKNSGMTNFVMPLWFGSMHFVQAEQISFPPQREKRQHSDYRFMARRRQRIAPPHVNPRPRIIMTIAPKLIRDSSRSWH
jgi:hypothetical protein